MNDRAVHLRKIDADIKQLCELPAQLPPTTGITNVPPTVKSLERIERAEKERMAKDLNTLQLRRRYVLGTLQNKHADLQQKQ